MGPRKNKRLVWCVAVWGLLGMGSAQCADTDPDSLVFERYVQEMRQFGTSPLNELVVKTALFFSDCPYVASTLEQSGGEHLVVDLREFDCTTFVENCLALSQTIRSSDKSFSHFKALLLNIRYRDAQLVDYSSRLHYSSDWIFDNQQKGVCRDMTLPLGGSVQSKEINFMSTHPQLYHALAKDSLMQQKISKMEAKINLRKSYALLPKEKILRQEKKMHDGDIVFFGTRIAGLDFSHVGIIYRDKGVLTFIHASSAAKKVIVQASSLSEYCGKSKNCNGVAVVRLNEFDIKN